MIAQRHFRAAACFTVALGVALGGVGAALAKDHKQGKRIAARPFVFVAKRPSHAESECGDAAAPGSSIVSAGWLGGMGLPDDGVLANAARDFRARRDDRFGLLLSKNGNRRPQCRTLRNTLLAAAALALVAPVGAMADDDNDNRGDNTDKVFFLFGRATPARDPENPANEVLRFEANSATGTFSGVRRLFNDKKVQVRDLDNQLESRHRFESPDTCGGGSPRAVLQIDLDNDGDTEGTAVVDLGTFPSFAGCQPETWLYEDFTGGDGITGLGPSPSIGDPGRGEQNGGLNEEAEVETGQLSTTGAGQLDPEGPVIPAQAFVITWSQFETVVTSSFPNNRVCSASYVDDVGAPPFFSPLEGLGISHADLISLGDATLNGHEDLIRPPRNIPSDTCRVKVKRGGRHGHDDDDDRHHDDDD